MKKQIVVKSNDLIEASYKLSLSEQRVILACISKIQPHTKIKDVHFEVTAQELANLSQIDIKKAYQSLKEAVEKLAERWIIVDIPNPKDKYSKYKTRWISGIAYEDEASIRLTFAYDILPFLSQLHGQFTQYSLVNVTQFSSIYAIRLYELIVQWKTTGKREIEINYFKNLLQLKKDEYLRVFNLKKRVIDPAIKQINEHSDFWVAYGQKKRGRKITHFIFEFGLKEEQSKKSISKPKKAAKDPILEALMLNGLSQAIAKRFLNENGTKSVQKTLKYYEQCLKEGKILKEGGGYLIRLLESKAEYQQPSSTNTKRMTLSEYCRLPENHRRTMGKNDSELIVMMRREGIIVER